MEDGIENGNMLILKVQEEERQRIARDLHDTSLQNLTYLIHKIELSSFYIESDPARAKLELSAVNQCLRETIEEMRNTIFDLRPMTFDDFGLKESVEQLIQAIYIKGNYQISSDIDNVSCETNLVLVSIFRLIKESLDNIVKHADADRISISCKNKGDSYIIHIRDNGHGFDMNQELEGNHFGLSLMRERVRLLNGTIQIKSEIGKGTEIYSEIPLRRVCSGE